MRRSRRRRRRPKSRSQLNVRLTTQLSLFYNSRSESVMKNGTSTLFPSSHELRRLWEEAASHQDLLNIITLMYGSDIKKSSYERNRMRAATSQFAKCAMLIVCTLRCGRLAINESGTDAITCYYFPLATQHINTSTIFNALSRSDYICTPTDISLLFIDDFYSILHEEFEYINNNKMSNNIADPAMLANSLISMLLKFSFGYLFDNDRRAQE